MTDKNKVWEEGELLISLALFWHGEDKGEYEQIKKCIHEAYNIPTTSEREEELEKIIIKMQKQINEKPEIDEKWYQRMARQLMLAINQGLITGLNEAMDFIRQVVADVLKAKKKSGFEIGIYIDDILDDIIDVFIEHADCEHTEEHVEYPHGRSEDTGYSIKSEKEVKEKLRKILEGDK